MQKEENSKINDLRDRTKQFALRMIIEDLQAALEQFKLIAEDLGGEDIGTGQSGILS